MATFDLTVAPADVSSTCKRQVAQYNGPSNYINGTGDVVDPNDVRMGKVFAILGVTMVGAQLYLIYFDPSTSAIFWYNATSGLEVAGGDLSTAGGRVEVIGQ